MNDTRLYRFSKNICLDEFGSYIYLLLHLWIFIEALIIVRTSITVSFLGRLYIGNNPKLMYIKYLYLIVLLLFLQVRVYCQNKLFFFNQTGRPVLVQKRTILEVGSFPYELEENKHKLQELPIETNDPSILNVIIVPQNAQYGTATGVYYLFKPGDTVVISANSKGQPLITHISSPKRTNELAFALDIINNVNVIPFYTLLVSNPDLYRVLYNPWISLKRRDYIIDSLTRPYVDKVTFYALKNGLDTNLGNLYKRHFQGMLYYYKLMSYNPNAYRYRNEVSDFYKDSLIAWSGDLNCDECSNIPFYKMAAKQIVDLRTKGLTDKSYLYEVAMLTQSSLRDFLLSQHMLEALAGGGSNKEELMQVYDSLCSQALYKEIVHNNYLLATTSLADQKDKAWLMKADKSKVGFTELLSSLKGKVVYIDFWASWCRPCIEEIPFSHKLKEKLNGADVAMLYISTDTDFDSWIKAAQRFKVNENSFILMNAGKDELIQKLSLEAIPRYIVIGRDGKIIDKDASRPSNKATLPLLLKATK